MILKSYIVEQNFNILYDYKSVLIYGENEGIKEDVKLKLKKTNPDTEIINFFENEIIKNKNILYDSIINESLFSKKKIILIQYATDKIFNNILECLDRKTKDITVYIFSENLEKKTKLRNLFEKEKKLAIIPCYKDNEKTLISYISKKLSNFKGLTGEILNLIIANSNSERKIIQSEIIKIKGFFTKKVIDKNNLLELLNIRSNTDFDEIRDSALSGGKKKLNKLLSEVDILNEESFLYLNSVNYRINKLTDIQRFNEVNNDYEKTLDNIKPPVFWKDKPIYLQQLKKWNLKKLGKMALKISEAEILMKKNSQIRNDIIIKNLILLVYNEASIS